MKTFQTIALSALLLSAGTAFAQTNAPTPPPAPTAPTPPGSGTQPTPAADEKPEPKLLPWIDRVEPRSYGAALGYQYTVEWGLDLVSELYPAASDRVNAARSRRAKILSGGQRELEATFARNEVDVNQIRTSIRTPELEKQLRAVLTPSPDVPLKEWTNFEQSASVVKFVSLIYSIDPAHAQNPAAGFADGVTVNWNGACADKTTDFAITAQLPIGWAPGPKTKNSGIAFRAVSFGGYGDDVVTVMAESIERELSPDQEKAFWKKINSPEAYAKTGATLLDLTEGQLHGERVVLYTSTATNQYPTYASRLVLKQLMGLKGRWTYTVQIMSTQQARLQADLPSADQGKENLSRLNTIWERLLDSMKIEITPKAEPKAEPAKP